MGNRSHDCIMQCPRTDRETPMNSELLFPSEHFSFWMLQDVMYIASRIGLKDINARAATSIRIIAELRAHCHVSKACFKSLQHHIAPPHNISPCLSLALYDDSYIKLHQDILLCTRSLLQLPAKIKDFSLKPLVHVIKLMHKNKSKVEAVLNRMLASYPLHSSFYIDSWSDCIEQDIQLYKVILSIPSAMIIPNQDWLYALLMPLLMGRLECGV